METPPLILTARMDEGNQVYFNNLRSRYFPVDRNYLAAHVTLFHHLPGDQLEAILRQVSEALVGLPRMEGTIEPARRLGSSVAFPINCTGLMSLHQELQQRWLPELTPQDSQPLNPHITVQNKVENRILVMTHKSLSTLRFERDIHFTALELWNYQGGPWSLVRTLPFAMERQLQTA